MPFTRSNRGTAQSTDRRRTADAQPRPLLLRFANLTVHGHGFVAEVQIEGRALAVSWHRSWLIATVEPAGFGDIGDELHEAFGSLRGKLCATLFHIADETGGYAEFERETGRVVSFRLIAFGETWGGSGLNGRRHAPTDAEGRLPRSPVAWRFGSRLTNSRSAGRSRFGGASGGGACSAAARVLKSKHGVCT